MTLFYPLKSLPFLSTGRHKLHQFPVYIMIGMFFILNRYEEPNDGATTPQSTLNRGPNSGTYKMVARALYNFTAQNYRELSFKKGDLIYVRRQVDDNWYEGERNAMIGIFPVTYVEVVPNENVGSLRSNKNSTLSRNQNGQEGQQTEGKGKAKFNFQAQTPMELSLIKGEMVILTRRVDANWYEGRIGSRKGIFPSAYVEVLLEPGEPRGLSPTPIIKPVAAPAAHSILKNGSLPVPSYNPTYSVTSPYSTINVSFPLLLNNGCNWFVCFSVSTWIFHVSNDDTTNCDQQFIPFYCGMQIGTSPVSRKWYFCEKCDI